MCFAVVQLSPRTMADDYFILRMASYLIKNLQTKQQICSGMIILNLEARHRVIALEVPAFLQPIKNAK